MMSDKRKLKPCWLCREDHMVIIDDMPDSNRVYGHCCACGLNTTLFNDERALLSYWNIPTSNHAPALLHRLEIATNSLIGERDAFYDGLKIDDESGIPVREEDQEEMMYRDKEIRLNQEVIAKARGESQ